MYRKRNSTNGIVVLAPDQGQALYRQMRAYESGLNIVTRHELEQYGMDGQGMISSVVDRLLPYFSQVIR